MRPPEYQHYQNDGTARGMNDPHIDVFSGHRALSCSSEQHGERQSSTLGTAPRILIEPRPNTNARVGKVTLRQRIRRAVTVRELRRLIRDAPTATIRNDLLTIAARNERPGR